MPAADRAGMGLVKRVGVIDNGLTLGIIPGFLTELNLERGKQRWVQTLVLSGGQALWWPWASLGFRWRTATRR